jgi:lipoyl(octanoyl) transferase
MQAYCNSRQPGDADVLWLCEHPSVFTLGQAGKAEHVLAAGGIPVLPSTRGGQVTFHGPGQVVAYPMVDLRPKGYFVKEFVHRIEEAVIRTLMHVGITGHRVPGAPGIYVRMDDPHSHARLVLPPKPEDHGFVGLGKVAALGIKVSRHCTYHGVALNVAMDLEPFSRINPCGYPGLRTVDLQSLGVQASVQDVTQVLAQQLVARL